ncbi:hypothetical protein HDF16_005717 [Granulicella aggregans]|uniref:Uncharacterized protein n=1 Tax=Granulicella aggregans TaxID=474949 RepID=A0A7W7ZJC1_9BACT|nr:hypothetical protein [Granulicella aggregans]MBB5060981.1 hypothetical protein [Granulicella aggregans]
MSNHRVPPPLFSEPPAKIEEPSFRAKTLATRLPKAEMEAVEAAASAANKTCSEWLRDAAIAHLNRPVRIKKSTPDPTLLAEIVGLRSIVVNLLAAVAVDLPKETIQRIVTQADSVKQGKADEILRRLEDQVKPYAGEK